MMATLLGVSANTLFRFDSSSPRTISSMTTITGLQSNEVVVGIDFRPATGQLYALGSTSRLYTVNPLSGIATAVGSGPFTPGLIGGTVDFGAFGFDFSPVSDLIRVVSASDQNLRLDPVTGTVSAVDGTLAYDIDTDGPGPDTGDVNAGVNPNVRASASIANSTGGEILYGIDAGDLTTRGRGATLVFQDPANAGILRTVGLLFNPATDTVIQPFFDTIDFDIDPVGNVAYAVITHFEQFGEFSDFRTSLFEIDLETGRATEIGSFPDLIFEVGLAVVPPGTLQFSAPSYSVNEGGLSATIQVDRVGGSEGTVTVDLTTSDGTAQAGLDYTASTQTLTFAPGITTAFATIPIADDLLDEPDETVLLALSNPTGGAVLGPPSTATLTILDNDPPPAVSLTLTGSPLAENGGVATVTATLSAVSTFDVTVNLGFTGTAGGSDYAPSAMSIVIPASSLSGGILLTGIDDTLSEDPETIVVDVASVANGVENGTQQVTALLVDDDPLPALSIDDVAVPEGDAGSVPARFTVRLSAPSGRTVTVAVATADNTAAAPVDYTPVQAVLVFPPGQTTQTVDVLVNGDMLVEPNETFFVNLSSGAINATIARGQGIGTILDDDVAGDVQFLTPTFAVAEDAGTAVITVVRTGGSDDVLSVPFSTSDGTASAGRDYLPVSGVLVFGPGQMTTTFTVPILDDLLIEGDETVLLTLGDPTVGGPPSGGPVAPGTSNRTAVLTIVDDDSLAVTNTADSGRGSLRRAIQTSNDPGNPLLGTITFAIPGAGVQTIRPLSALPTITRPVIVDATTQPGFAGTPVVELDGSRAESDANGLVIAAGRSTVRGLAINRFSGSGIVLVSNGGNTIQGNFLGTDASGSVDLGNDRDGVQILDAPGNTIGGTAPGTRNVLSGNGDPQNPAAGINITGLLAGGNFIQSNLIGTDATGTRALGNSFHGVFVGGAPNTMIIGNVISANGLARRGGEDGVGVYFFGGGGHTVQGNLIGTDFSGTRDLGNTKIGVLVSDSPGNTIGGSAPGSRNVISGNGLIGLELAGAGATGNVVQGNLIGLDATGLRRLGNGIPDNENQRDGIGVFINNAPGNLIGGAGAGNVISGNLSVGVQFLGPGATGNRLQGNRIGTNATGTAAVGNVLDGVFVSNAPGNVIGGRRGVEGNVISGNGANGLHLNGIGSTGNVVQGNLIGLDSLGTRPLANGRFGLLLNAGAGGNTIVLAPAADANQIGPNTLGGLRNVNLDQPRGTASSRRRARREALAERRRLRRARLFAARPMLALQRRGLLQATHRRNHAGRSEGR